MHRPTPLSAARWALDGLLMLLVGIAVLALLVARVLPALGHEAVTITGRSMEPTIPVGSAIVLSRVAPTDISVGDIVTVTVPGARITYTHRVVEIIARSDRLWLRTKGDYNDAADPALVGADWVVGRHVITFPGLGLLLRLLALPSGMFTVLGLALTLFLAARLVEELEWEIEEERRRPVRPAFPGTASMDEATQP